MIVVYGHRNKEPMDDRLMTALLQLQLRRGEQLGVFDKKIEERKKKEMIEWLGECCDSFLACLVFLGCNALQLGR